MRGDTRKLTNRYWPSLDREEELRFCVTLLDSAEAIVDKLFKEIEQDTEFVTPLQEQYACMRPERSEGLNIGWMKVWYALVRALSPATVMETGVHDGLSSALILRALERNGTGVLVSIDLPSTDLPLSATGPGWLVADVLRSRWHLYIGDARRLLPQIAPRYAPIDIFIHDSNPAPGHQRFEFCTVRPYMKVGGLILSNQAYPSRRVLDDLASEWGTVRFYRMKTLHGDPGGYVGGVRLAR